MRDDNHVCVSCVFTHVSSRRTPVNQSFLPCSESSWNLGGVETLAGAVVTAPSIRRPGKKQTRWSCLGASNQVLILGSVAIQVGTGRAHTRRHWYHSRAPVRRCMSCLTEFLKSDAHEYHAWRLRTSGEKTLGSIPHPPDEKNSVLTSRYAFSVLF